MPINGTYSGTSSVTAANSYSTIDEILVQLPDNINNIIDASDIRDSVFSLWTRVDSVQTLASQSASASSLYNNSTPVPLPLGGIAQGTTFSNKSVQEMFDMLLYPYIGPSCFIGGGVSIEFGNTSLGIPLSWSVTKGSNLIITIIVNGIPIIATGFNQSGVAAGVAVQNVNTTFSMSASDGTSTANSSTTVSWYNARYWGTAASFGALSSAQINALNGAGVGSGKELSTTRVQNRNGINGAGNYLAFAWPTSFGTPTFIINGLPNSAWTKVNTSFLFVNTFGYSTSYDVWMSNTAQNSPITLFQIN